jgi:thiol:disulfide interchange protein DsbG
MKRLIRSSLIVTALAVSSAAIGTEYEVADEVRDRIEPVLTKSGGELTYFEGPAGMIGVGVSFMNGRQMVVYATPDGSTVFSGVAVDVETGKNISNADMQNLPAPNYQGILDMLEGEDVQAGLRTTVISEGNPDSANKYYVFVDPKCPYCHQTYNAFLSLLADGEDLVVHYIPVGILGPESENIAKEMIARGGEEGLEVFRGLVRKESHMSDSDLVAAGSMAHGANLALFRKLQFDAVPVVISEVGGRQSVRRGMVPPETLLQELQVAAVQKVASAK